MPKEASKGIHAAIGRQGDWAVTMATPTGAPIPRNWYTPEGSIAGSDSTQGSLASKRRNRQRGMIKDDKREQEFDKLIMEFQFIRVADEERKMRNISTQVEFCPTNQVFQEFASSHPDALPSWFDPSLYTGFPSNDRAMMDHLHHFDREPLEGVRKYETQFRQAVDMVKIALEPDVKPAMPHLEDLADVPYKKHKYPGYEYRMKGFKTREDANAAAQVDAEAAWVELMDGQRVEPHSVRMGGRGKVVQGRQEDFVKDDVAKGRLILMLGQRDLKLLGVTEKPMTEICKAAHCPIYVGKSWFFRGGKKVYDELHGFEEYYCFDAKKFDSSLDPYLIHEAVKIGRSWFSNGEEERFDAYWEFVEDSLIRARIVRDDGFVFYKQCGTTSGHSHNTLFQSICTLILGYFTLIVNNPEVALDVLYENSKVFALGDDNLIAVRYPLDALDCEQYAATVEEATGINWFGDKSFATSLLMDWVVEGEEYEQGGQFQGVQFLGKYLKGEVVEQDGVSARVVLPYRPAWETLVKLAKPERLDSEQQLKTYTPYQLAYLRALGNYMDGATNPISRRVVDRFLNWLEEGGHAAREPLSERTVMKVFGDADASAEASYVLRRLTYEALLELLLCDKTDVVDHLLS